MNTANLEIQYAMATCGLGLVLVACSERGICAILPGEKEPVLVGELKRRFPRAGLVEGDARMEAVAAGVAQWLDAPLNAFPFPLEMHGTPFQVAVWEALREISAGATVSYCEVARKIGHPRAVRAVGRAVGANPLAVVVPCHRIIGADGSLTGYRWGLERKRWLLRREGVLSSKKKGAKRKLFAPFARG